MFTVQPGCDVGTIETFQDFKLTVSRVSGAPFARTEDVDDENDHPAADSRHHGFTMLA